MIWGAGLDVTSPEPMRSDDEMLKLDNVLITPHIGSADEETRQAVGIVAAINIIYALNGLKIPNCINSEIYSNK